jgi:hypothetical protein
MAERIQERNQGDGATGATGSGPAQATPALTPEEQLTAAVLFDLIASARAGRGLIDALGSIAEKWPQFAPVARALALHQTIARGEQAVGRKGPARKRKAH